MGRAFLTTQYLASPPPPTHKATGPHRWSAQAFDPDQEVIDGLDMVYEAVVDPAAAVAVPESAVRTPLSVTLTARVAAAVSAHNAASPDDDKEPDDASDGASTAVSSPSSVSSNEAQQLAALQRRLFGGEPRARSSTSASASGNPTADAHAYAAQRMQDHMLNLSSLYGRAQPVRRAVTLSTLDLVTRPAVAQST